MTVAKMPRRENMDADSARRVEIELLKAAGVSEKDLSHYFVEDGRLDDSERQIRYLRKTRRALLNAIHEKQALLDKIDFLIWDKQRRERQ